MAITSAICTSFKQELLVGTHNFTATSGNSFKLSPDECINFMSDNQNK